jgi:hypothetical protein
MTTEDAKELFNIKTLLVIIIMSAGIVGYFNPYLSFLDYLTDMDVFLETLWLTGGLIIMFGYVLWLNKTKGDTNET